MIDRGAALRAALLVVVLALLVAGFAHSAHAMRLEKLKLITQGAQHVIDVEVTETPAEKAQGLMFRTRLPDTSGMLFFYETPQEITMWMRNTYIPLDMVFIRADGIVHRIEAYTERIRALSRMAPRPRPLEEIVEDVAALKEAAGTA